MKKAICLLMVFALMLSCFALAETEITITGCGKISVPADSVTVTLGVSETAATAVDAQKRVNEKIAACRDALNEAGVPDSDISTASINLSEITEYLDTGNYVVSGYYAYSSIAVRLDEIEKSGTVVDLAVDCGVNSITGVSFSIKDPGAHNEPAITAACADANAKAELYAKAMGLTITGVKSIHETSSDSYESGPSFENFARDKGSTELSANNVEVVTYVSITYSAE